MSVDIPDSGTLLGFVPTAQYGDEIDADRLSDVPVDLGSAQQGARGGALHISSVLPALSAAIGTPVRTDVHVDAEGLRQRLGMPCARSAIVVLVDGLGYWNLNMKLGYAPYMRSLMNEPLNQRPISTCSPSTTTAAMATFGTGTCPGLTGMAGYTQLNPRTGALSQLIQFRGAMHPEELQTEPTVFSLIRDAGNRATSVGLTRFMASPLTRAALRGSNYIGHDDANKRVRIAADTAKEPGLTYLYMREIDKAGHAYGWHSDEWQVALERVDMRLGQLRRQVPKGTLIVVIADHGMVTADQGDEARIDIALDPVLQQGVRLVGGEPRATMLYAQDGVDDESIAERWRARVGDRAWIRTKRQVIDCGLLGPMRPDVPEMLGDVFVYAARGNTIVDTRSQTEGATRMPGVHGSQTMMEMDVPCLIDLVD